MSDMNDFNTSIITEFRANDGVVGGPFAGGTLVLLHTTGAKSGAERINPLVYLDYEGRRFIFASKGGADTDPDWFRNIQANSAVTLEIGTETFPATATALPEPERTRIYDHQAEVYPQFAEYQAGTSRIIPVVELSR